MGSRNLIEAFAKPQYLFRPSQLARRILQIARPPKLREVVTLQWRLKIEVDTADGVGSALALQSVYDLVTTEVLWRLALAMGWCLVSTAPSGKCRSGGVGTTLFRSSIDRAEERNVTRRLRAARLPFVS